MMTQSPGLQVIWRLPKSKLRIYTRLNAWFYRIGYKIKSWLPQSADGVFCAEAYINHHLEKIQTQWPTLMLTSKELSTGALHR